MKHKYVLVDWTPYEGDFFTKLELTEEEAKELTERIDVENERVKQKYGSSWKLYTLEGWYNQLERVDIPEVLR